MKGYGILFSFSLCLLVLAAAITLACGSSAPHILQSVSITPATADAQNYPSGQVQFTAAGFYGSSPRQVSPLKATWGACIKTANLQEPTTSVSVSNGGLAQCASGANGTFTIWAYGVNPRQDQVCTLVIGPCGEACGSVIGAAQLTCP